MSLLPKTTLTTHHLTTHPHLSLYPFSTILHLLPSPQTHTSSFTFPPPIPSPYLQHFNLSTFLLPFLPSFISYLPPLLTFFFTFLQLFLYLFYKISHFAFFFPLLYPSSSLPHHLHASHHPPPSSSLLHPTHAIMIMFITRIIIHRRGKMFYMFSFLWLPRNWRSKDKIRTLLRAE